MSKRKTANGHTKLLKELNAARKVAKASEQSIATILAFASLGIDACGAMHDHEGCRSYRCEAALYNFILRELGPTIAALTEYDKIKP